MNAGAAESAEHVASGFIEALKREPLSLALVLMNLALLVFFWVLLSTVAAQREREVNLLYADHKEVRDLLAKCVVPSKQSDKSPLYLPAIKQIGD
jgi:hypothetical protein